MKRFLLFLLFVSSLGFAQSSGITYQAVIYNPNGEELPGVDNPYAPLTNQDVCLQFGIVDASGSVAVNNGNNIEWLSTTYGLTSFTRTNISTPCE